MTMTAPAPVPPAAATTPPVPRAAGIRRLAFWRSPEGQPAWARPGLLALALAAGLVYGYGVRNGQLHNYYSAAVKSMSVSWKAFLYGGYDPAASITIDKLPGAFQIEALSARVLGFSTWSLLLPQVIESVLAILVLYRVVNRWRGPVAAMTAATAFATMPIVAALAHAEISDTLLTLLLILAADACQRATTTGRPGPLLLSGVWVGLAFQTKMVQAWGVLPALAVAYLVAAPGTWPRRIRHVLVAGVVTAAVSLYWVILVTLTPASMRPYIDGSTDNSAWSMVFNYNLLSRYGTGTGPVAMGGAGGQGWTYMFTSDVATQVGWLYPLALIALVAGLWLRRRTARTDTTRAGYLMWGLWLAVHAAAFSTGRVAHSFYTVATAPAIAALAGAGLVTLWHAHRYGGPRRWLLPLALLATVAWTLYLSARYPTFMPWLTPLVAILGTAAVALLVGPALVGDRLRTRLGLVAAVATIGALFSAPAVWAASTVDSTYTGSGIGPAAGPVRSMGGPGGDRGGPGGFTDRGTGTDGQGAGPAGGFGVPPGQSGQPGTTPDGNSSAGDALNRGGTTGGPGAASATPGARTLRTVAWLNSHDPGTRYLLAVQGSQSAGDYIIAGASVLPIGGFTGQVPNVTGTSLAKLVASGELRYVVVGGGMGGGGMGGFGQNSGSAVSSWVTANCTTVDDSSSGLSNLYDCKATS